MLLNEPDTFFQCHVEVFNVRAYKSQRPKFRIIFRCEQKTSATVLGRCACVRLCDDFKQNDLSTYVLLMTYLRPAPLVERTVSTCDQPLLNLSAFVWRFEL